MRSLPHLARNALHSLGSRGVAPSWAAGAAALALALSVRPAQATGMQGHIYMAQCAAEQISDARLRPILDAHQLDLANGAFFPDSGYTTDDYDQGEIPHWEGYVEAYIQLLRERSKTPVDEADMAAKVAFLMGIAAHGMSDSTFDTLFYTRGNDVDPGNTDDFDTAMDVFLVHDMPRYFVPDVQADVDTLSEVFTRVSHPVAPEKISAAMSLARTGIAAVTTVLASGADRFGESYPWSRAHLLDRRTPGGYAFGAKVVAGYYEQLLRRLDGDVSADGIVIGSYPDAHYPMVTLDHTRPDGKIVLFFGHGLDRASIVNDTVVVRDGQGGVIPTSLSIFRGDTWPNAFVIESMADWQPATTYTVTVSKAIRTLHGASPSQDIELSFTTCTPDAAGSDCPEPAGDPPPSLCPKTEAAHAEPPPEEEPEEPVVEPETSKPAAQSSGGCAAAPSHGAGSWWSLLLLAVPAAFRARARRERS